MPDSIDPDGPGFLIGDVARLFRTAFEREVARDSRTVTPAEARVLAHMARCGAVRQNRLACALGVAPMSLTVFLDRLEGAGLVERGPDPDDRRAKIVTLTRAADEVLVRVAAAGERALDRACEGIGEDDRARFMRLARTMRDNLGASQAGAAKDGKDGQT